VLARWFRADEVMNDERGWAFNLALFRIIFLYFAVLPFAMGVLRWTEYVMPVLPATVWVPISFYRYLPFHVVSDSGLAYWLAVVNVAVIIMGILGVFTRYSLAVATLLSVYVFGLIENQGKVDHFHHLVWFMAILAAGPSGRFLSVDSVIRSIRSADRGVVDPDGSNGSSLAALRYVWLLIGLAYLLPGLAKLESSLTRGWASAGNLQQILWRKWFESSLYIPGFEMPWRIDGLPMSLLTLGGLSVIAFECGFILLVLFRPLRPFLAVSGLAFHLGNGLFLGIFFGHLMVAYVCLIDWTGIAKTAWRRVNRTRLLVLYDGSCRLCRRTLALLRSIDMVDRLEPVPASTWNDSRRRRHPALTDEILFRDMYTVRGETVEAGFAAYRRIATQVPLLWPLVPIMALPPVAAGGQLVYRRVADSRACSLVHDTPMVRPTRSSRSAAVIHWVGGALVILEAGVGGWMLAADLSSRHLASDSLVRRLLHGVAWRQPVWPFDSYPMFSGVPAPEIKMWEARLVVKDGREVRIDARTYAVTFGGGARSWSVVQPLLREKDTVKHRARSHELVRALWRNISREVAEQAVAVRVYHVDYILEPTGPRSVGLELMYAFEVPP
jgi:predicted DCC family thiol-disulfide oxidoreductase YuxK